MTHALTLNNIEVIYDHVFLAIKGVSIEVPQGGMVALLGANGAGKSTTLKSISGLLKSERGEITRGSVQFMGQDIGKLAPQDRVKLGIAQAFALIPGTSRSGATSSAAAVGVAARRSAALKCWRPSTSVLRVTACLTLSPCAPSWLRIAVRMKSVRLP